jgi:hypothetical protein
MQGNRLNVTIVESAQQMKRVKKPISGPHADNVTTCLSVALNTGEIRFEWLTRFLTDQEIWRCHNLVKTLEFRWSN